MRERSDIPEFDVHLDATSETLVAGFAEYGLAGLTAVDYLVEQLAFERTGHVAVEGLPAITPFENGTPRHHTRLFSGPAIDVTVLAGELFVPAQAAEMFGEAILEMAAEHDIQEVVVLSGVPFAHGPDEHRPFYIASEDFRRARLDGDHGVAPMSGGFLEGINGELMQRALDTPLRTCVLTTPVHPQTPDVEASLRLLEAFDSIYEVDLDTGPLEAFAATVTKQYEELAARLESQRQDSQHDDRMYM